MPVTNKKPLEDKSTQSVRGFLLWESFDRSNKKLFFGRDREVKALYDKTFASNLLLLYGPSGAGKTSLVRCGLGNMFEKSDWFPIFIRKGDNIVRSLSLALKTASENPAKLRNSSIREKIHELFLEKFRPIFLIFDQFEELFILGNREEQDQFFTLLMDLLAANFQCKIILSIKEDYIADLDFYEESIPVLFYNRMRVERMRTEQLEEVVKGMTSNMRISLGRPDDDETEKQKIIDSIFDNVRDDVNRIDLGELQIFLDELYSKDEARQLRAENMTRPIMFDRELTESMDYVDVVIARRLQKRLEDLDLKFKQKAQKDRLPHLILRELVTELETKRSRTIEGIEKNLFEQDKILPVHIEECVQTLVNTGILRNLDAVAKNNRRLPIEKRHLVEIVHDNLAKKLYPLLFHEEQNIIRVKNFISIQHETFLEAGVKLSKDDLEYIQPYLAQIKKDLPEEHIKFVEISRREVRKREWRLGIFMAGLSLFLLASTVVAIFQWSTSSRRSAANNISAKALGALSYDRTVALRLSEIALEKDPLNTLANNVLNDVLIDVSTFPFYQDVYEISSQEIDRFSDLDVSENGKYLLAGSLDGGLYLLHLWNSNGLQPLQFGEMEQHSGEITDVDFIEDIPNLKYGFLTSSNDGTAKLWQIANDNSTATLLKTYAQEEPLSAVMLNQMKNEHYIFTAGEEKINQWCFDIEQEENCLQDSFLLAHTNAFEIVEFRNDHYLLAASRDTTFSIIRLSDKKGPDPQRIPGESTIISLDFIKQGRGGKFAAGLEDGRLITWSLNADFLNGNRTIANSNYDSKEAHSQAIKDVVFINDGRQILTSSKDKSAKLWNADLSLQKTFLGHNDGVQTITSAEEGEYIYTGGEDKTIKKWKLDMIEVESMDRSNVLSIDFSASQNKLLLRSHESENDEFILYTINDNELNGDEFELERNIKGITNMALSPDGQHMLLTADGNPDILLIGLNGELIHTLPGKEDQNITGLTFSPDGNFVLSMRKDTATIWQKQQNQNHYHSFLSLPINMRTAALAYADNELRLLYTDNHANHKAYLWSLNIEEEQSIPRLDSIMHTDEVLSVALSPDGRNILTGSKDNSFFFNTISKNGTMKSNRKQRHTSDVNFVAFSPGSSPKHFLTASQNGHLRLWNIDGQEEKSYIDNGSSIVHAVFLSDTNILSLGADGLVKKWDTEDIEDFIKVDGKNIYSLGEDQKRTLLKE